VGPSRPLAFEILEPSYLPFHLSGTPRFTQSRTHGSMFGMQPQGKAVQFLQWASAGLLEPCIELIALALTHHRHKPARKARRLLLKRDEDERAPDQSCSRVREQLGGITQEEPFRAAWGSEEFVVQPSDQKQ
jgi:hypothetical protein